MTARRAEQIAQVYDEKESARCDMRNANDITAALDEHGFAILPELVNTASRAELHALYDDDTRFRSTINMARYGFGLGEYRYFCYPLPTQVQVLRENLYRMLAPLANCWAERLNDAIRFPDTHVEYVTHCHAAGQPRPSPLLLRYRRGDYNCLHQDIYGPCAFPFQVICLLSEPDRDFAGGELILVEQRPRRQSRASVLPLRAGDGVVIATNHVPRRGTRGYYRATLKHGVSTVTCGERLTLGLIFHDAS